MIYVKQYMTNGKKTDEGALMKNLNQTLTLTGFFLLAAAAAGQFAARTFENFGSWYSTHVYSSIVAVVGRLWGLFPVSVAEFGIYGLGIVCLWYVIRHRSDWRSVASRAFFILGGLAFLYTYQCGINYYRRPFSAELSLEVRKSSTEELRELCQFLTEKVKENADSSEYDRDWALMGRRAMIKLGREYPGLAGYYPKPKGVAVSWILSVQQLCGIYSPFTVEANYNQEMTDYNIPHTICHELSHLRGYMREDEANFIGYLACIKSEERPFMYSGYLTGWVYATNALAGQDMESYRELYEQLPPQVIQDLSDNNAFWNQYEGKIAEVSNQMNDTYLKMNDQEEGVRTYGRMVDLMLAYHRDSEK